MTDLLIKNARVIDGSGAPSFAADIAVSAGVITHVAAAIDLPYLETIDGSGLVVSPGFIDMHTHSDFSLLLEPTAGSRVRQGITTEVTGNCGGSPGPILDSGSEPFMEYMSDLGVLYKRRLSPEDWNWKTLDGFYARLAAKGTAVNLVPLVGHSTLRANVMGYDNSAPNHDQMEEMKRLLTIELEKGAFGLSSGLIYHPGAFAQTGELAELARVVKDFNGIYATHMRSEGKFLFEAVDEALAVARESGVSLQISHLKCETPAMWGKGTLLLEKIHQARRDGLLVNFDQYPYTAYHTGLLEIFPVWAKEGGSSKMIEILNNSRTREKVMADMVTPPVDWDNPMEDLGWDRIQIMGYTRQGNLPLNGLTVAAMAKARGLDPLEAVCQVFCEENGALAMIVFAMSEQDVVTIMQDPYGMIGSDGRSVTPSGPASGSPVHPRYYGTFARVLGNYVREKKIISLEQAVHKMTGMPAEKLGLTDRGLIREGLAADLVLFDPETVRDVATFEDSHRYAEGIPYVFVNGKAVIFNGNHTGNLPGKKLLRDA
ncbi:D-aminoacylase [Desulfopila sp. IMCC35006]|uniref:N-acyl-D-amino-acid deacylase family protein n=1 Tax=Desulfopila sp. IMCC35006 TaxID=2569542 RepID=UPI0010ACABB6|nr:D-aminoacylase [Desulfopila sp. IMCC35006]TKB28552.1 D-aminoacylase [Desulfopila sp. IMCC35006]